MNAKEPSRRQLGRPIGRIFLVVAPIALLAMALALIAFAPATNLAAGYYFDVIGGSRRVILSGGNDSANGPSESIVIDLDDGTWSRPISTQHFRALHSVNNDGTLNCLEFLSDRRLEQDGNNARYLRVDSKTGETIRSRELRFPPNGGLASLRTLLVYTKAGNVCITDFSESGTFVVSKSQINPSDAIDFLPETGNLHTVRTIPSGSADPTSPSSFEHRLFAVEHMQKPELIATWRSAAIPDESWGALRSDIASVDRSWKRIQVRSGQTGEIAAEYPVPETFPFDTATKVYLRHGVIFTEDATGRISQAYDFRNQTWAPAAQDGSGLIDGIASANLRLWREAENSNQYFVFESGSQQPRCSFVVSGGDDWVARLVDADRVVVSTRRFGGSVEVFDSHTGKRLQVHRPFQWIAWTLVALVLGSIVWFTAWMRRQACIDPAKRRPAWRTTIAVLGIPLLLLGARVYLVGNTSDTSRLPYAYLQAISTAMISLSAIGFVFGRSAWTRRIAPLGLIIAISVAMISVCFPNQPAMAWQAIASVTFPVAVSVGWLWVFRLIGFQITNRNENTAGLSGSSPDDDRRRWPIRDLFLITAVASLVFAVIRPILPHADELTRVSYLIWPVLFVNLMLAVSLALILSPSPRVFCLASVIVAGVLLALAAEPIVQFIGWGPWNERVAWHYVARVVAVYGVALAVGLIPFRVGGFRLAFRDSVAAAEALPLHVGSAGQPIGDLGVATAKDGQS